MPNIRRVTVRLAPAAHSYMEAAAAEAGVPLAQWLREAAFIRLAWQFGVWQSGVVGPEETLKMIAEQLQKLAEMPPGPIPGQSTEPDDEEG